MSAYDTEAVAAIPVAVLPPGIRHATLSMEAHEQNHLAIGMGGEKYLVVHPTYSLAPHLYSRRMLGAVLLVLLEVAVFLFTLLGLCTPCITVHKRKYFALLGGHGGSMTDPPGRNLSLIACSVLIIVLFVFSFIFSVVVACCVRCDQRARVSEELFNRELLELYGAQVHDDGRVYSAGGEPSALKDEGMWGPCCGFEANERSRRSRNTGISCLQCIVVTASLILEGAAVYNMKWMHRTAVASGETATYEKGFSVTVFALVLRLFQLLFYCYMAFHMLYIGSHRSMPRCQLIHTSSTRAAGVLSTHGEAASSGDQLAKIDSESGYPSKPRHSAADREGDREMELIPNSRTTLHSCP
ncbi:hypothetical protein conserved [Leishmania donovani]|uniref:Uncharacterized protein n=3 Tax=Leishmania donovani species complex TaxID=38574 RepID=A4I300_LEIIN|nr:hypothetical protein, unknown function [Leishmania infantum JPCM5]XP_003862035.1 hypothetical protein, unknown function [Leishmania donovani]CAC9500339.1 hypothetical_protein_-_conserved [Leishmania infantum]AYU80084.1 hypothetical protein LdCL_270025600 [Leishmania donovani]TPP45998.1 hypothetical protein CGC20_32410 [Leishmania donovani]TPP47459.1 hypothetical protein CGC21_30505 [Leishmania donovani]CAJ1990070.1 hypothetical protein conserved [Leishmania donovani]|eukprot:XP_001466433.1 hypothetical protein, unknown function [Leishmania infantum JPCM5]